MLLWRKTVQARYSIVKSACIPAAAHIDHSDFAIINTMYIGPYIDRTQKQMHLLARLREKDEMKLICMYLNPK